MPNYQNRDAEKKNDQSPTYKSARPNLAGPEYLAAAKQAITHKDRTPGSKVLEFAQDATDIHFVLGTNVRMASMRFALPELCADCAVIPNLLVFGGVGFATALVD